MDITQCYDDPKKNIYEMFKLKKKRSKNVSCVPVRLI